MPMEKRRKGFVMKTKHSLKRIFFDGLVFIGCCAALVYLVRALIQFKTGGY